MKRYLNIILILIGISNAAFAQDFNAKITLDKESIKIGEQIEMVLSVEFPVTESVDFVMLTDTITGELEIVEKGKIDTNYTGNNLSIKSLSQKIFITSFDSGYHTLPPFVFYSEKDSARTEPMLISVTDVEVQMSEASQQGEVEIKDIKDIRDVSFSLWEWIKTNWIWLASGFLLLVAIWAYFKYIHPNLKKKGASALIPKKVIPIHEVALKKLSTLESKKLWQSGKVKEYHSELTEIVREYIEERYNIPALESTTHEIMADLKQIFKKGNVSEDLNNMLVMADLVKFAKHSPLPNENELSIKNAYEFINETKEINTEPEESNTNSHNV